MAENELGNDGIRSCIQARIDGLIKRNSELLKYRDDLKNSSKKLYKINSRIEEVGIRLTKELEQLNSAEKSLNLEIEEAINKVEKKRKDIEKMRMEKDMVEKSRIDDLKIFERKVAEAVPKFENAPIVYSNANLTKSMEDLKEKNRKVSSEIFNVNRETEILLGKYGLEDNLMIIGNPEDELEIANLSKLKGICYDSTTAASEARKNIFIENEELLKIVERNNRKIINLKNN